MLHEIQENLFFVKLEPLVDLLQTGTLFNFFNRGASYLIHKKSNNKLIALKGNNIIYYFPSSVSSNFDSLNNNTTGYRLLHKCRDISLYKQHPLQLLFSYFLVQWSYIAFRGKSFRVRNFCRFNKLTLNFGYSHWTKLQLLKTWSFFKRRRQRYVIFTYALKSFKFFSKFFPRIKFYNCYTMRGLRLRKQPIIRRFGKISQHISSLH